MQPYNRSFRIRRIVRGVALAVVHVMPANQMPDALILSWPVEIAPPSAICRH